MTQRMLVLGDHHGDTESLRRVLDRTAGETFDFVVHVGDFTNAYREDREQAADQLRAVEPLLERLADRARHDLVWVWGNRDYFGDVPYALDVGTRIPEDGCVTVGGQRFTNSPAAVAPDVVLVTHMETWSLVDHFDGRAHFCGNTHLGRYRGRRLNSAYLQYTNPETGEQSYGGYFVVDVTDEPPFDVERREVGSLPRRTCEVHGERGVQYHSAFDGCMYCADQRILYRELAASSFYGCTDESGRDAASLDDIVEHAVGLWTDPPEGLAADFEAYLANVGEDRYAPLSRRDDGLFRVADESYAY